MRGIKIQYRLIGSFLFLSLIPLILMGAISYSKSGNAITSKINMYSSELMKQTAWNIETELSKYETQERDISYLETLQTYYRDLKTQSADDKLATYTKINKLVREKTTYKEITDEAVIPYDNNGDTSMFNTLVSIDKNELSRIIETGKAGKGRPVWLITVGTDNNVKLVVAREINFTAGGGKLGVAVFCIDAGHFRDMLQGINMGNGSEIFITDSNGLVMASRNDDIALDKPYGDINLINNVKKSRDDAASSDDGTLPALNYGDNLVAYSYLSGNGWYIIGLIPHKYITAEASSIAVPVIVLFIICLILAVVFSIIITASISTPLKKLLKIMREARDGNLTIKMRDRSNDEIGKVVMNFNDMVENIRVLISKVSAEARKVLDNSVKIESSAGLSYSASEQIAATMQEIAKGANAQADETAKGVEYTNRLAGGINRVGNDMNDVSAVVLQTQNLSEKALQSVQLLNDKAVETNSISEKVVNDINELNSYMKEIKKIVNVISGIAEQTNLLALNAAIEAARAGDAGKGFAVVAEEVKKLADKSKESSSMINDIIKNIQAKTDFTVATANSGNVIVREQMDAVHQTDAAFKTIYEAMVNIAGSMENMRQSVDDMLAYKDKTLETMENISTVSEESAATSQEVSASTQEKMSGADELSKLASELTEMANEMNSAVSIFKID